MKQTDRRLFMLILLFSVIISINCGRISFKDKLTAYAEKPEDEGTKSNQANKAASNNKSIVETKVTNSNYSRTIPQQYGQIPSAKSSTPDQTKTPSLWEITKNKILVPFQNNMRTLTKSTANFKNGDYRGIESGSLYSEKSHRENSLQNGTKVAPQPWQDFLMTVKTGFHGVMRNESRNSSSRATENYINSEVQQQNEQQRTKKDVGGSGLRDVIWHTAKALWSVNKEHFLPTFLHTKTGGKLSLIRDSIFKPVAILSQYKSGVREINNEKWKNLARLTSFGRGWGNPNSEVVVVKYKPTSSPILTLARYIFRLSKHTVVTKWRLKRALLDLQLRALKKLLRIISNKDISQKIAIIKILTNAVWKGKKAFLRIVTGNKLPSSPPEHETTYEGKDNAFNIDITYGSLSKPGGGGGWGINNFQPNTFAPPPAPSAYSYPLYTVPDPLIESPSYAHALKTMGVHPSNYQYHTVDDDTDTRSRDDAEPSASATPTVLYYSDDQPKTTTFDKNNPVKPGSSYSYHYSSSPQQATPSSSTYLPYLPKGPHESNPYVNSVLKRSTTTPSPFRLKLLEYMSAAP